VGAIWEMLLEKLGDIKEMILDQVKDFVLTKIITAGITWLISLLNPAAAFIKACKLIYDVVMFFVNNASRIAKFVNTILDSVADIVRGNISGVAAKIEDVLSQMVPIIIGFLASVIGLGGVGQKIREIVSKLQKPVNKALDFVIKTGLKLAGPVIRGIAGIAGKVKGKIAAGKAWVKGKVKKVGDFFRQIRDRMLGVAVRETFDVGGEKHEVFSRKGAPYLLFTASKRPKPTGKAVSDPAVGLLDAEFKAKMGEYYRLAGTMTGADTDRPIVKQANALFREAKALLTRIVAATKKAMDASGGGPGGHAPHIGEHAPHEMQQERLRPKDKGKEITAWRLESEHLIPRELISALFSVLPINAPVKNNEYDAMVTVLMYENASKEKTTTAAVGDLASIRRMKQLVREQFKTLSPRGRLSQGGRTDEVWATVLSEFSKRARSSLGRAASAVVKEQGTVGDARGANAAPRPGSDEILAAYEAQRGQVEEMFELRLAAVQDYRDEVR
jgi:hypothetical protein